MPHPLIDRYHNDIARALQHGKSANEQSVRGYFWVLLNEYARKHNYEVVLEKRIMGTHGVQVQPDGALQNSWGLTLGYWESKDTKDVLEEEVYKKQKKGYPLTNALFEDTQTAVLFQYSEEVMRVDMKDSTALHKLLQQWLAFKSAAVTDFEKALDNFKADIPILLGRLTAELEAAAGKNPDFILARDGFLELCRAEINPDVTEADVREMLIQHLLTAELFQKIFDEPDFHRENNIARELEKLLGTVFNTERRKNLLASIEHYYEAINATAAGITDHHEKQKFLKVLYENFYKAYNPKAADRLGVVYTPNEIVRFMVRSTDQLLHQHFGKSLSDEHVEILDPATGTGTFICDIIDHIPPHKLAKKYLDEIHANEVAILPYYVANLNIEFTFKQKMGHYKQFPNLCFVDTLDNTAGLGAGVQHDIFGISSENATRIRRQNERRISVVIGNPPYNANQKNENENNKNREYPTIDKRIKNTYIKHSTAQKTKAYDMYTRFYRWAMDRVDTNGVIAFITNRSFIDSRTLDGFRKCVQDEFAYAYIIDTHSDVRANPKIAGTSHNVFGIQTGVAVMFLVRKEQQSGPCQIFYTELSDEMRKEEKWEWFRVNEDFGKLQFRSIAPDKSNHWISIDANDFDTLLPSISKDVKAGRSTQALFKDFTLGVVTARDEWVFGLDEDDVSARVKHLIASYNKDVANLIGRSAEEVKEKTSHGIKWTRAVKRDLAKGKKYAFDDRNIIDASYRPFVDRKLYFSGQLNEMQYQLPYLFREENPTIAFLCVSSQNPLAALGTKKVFDYCYLKKGNGGTQSLSLYSFDDDGTRRDNLTDWGLAQFTTHYGDKKIKKEDVFRYVYAVLHDPAYREKYKLNLKREFPRIPFYKDFWQWSKWGKELMDLHIGYETVEPYKLELVTSTTKAEQKKQKKLIEDEAHEPQALYARQPKVKVKLKADKEAGIIELDELTLLKGIPREAWDYKLGNRSALEWVLDQYKEKTPKDPTIREKFNTYRFADHKEKVIDLLRRVCTVSVRTVEVVRGMEGTER